MADRILSWLDTDLATALTNLGMVGLAWAVFGLVLLVHAMRKRDAEPDEAPPPVAANETSAPIVLIRDHREPPYVWRNRNSYQGVHGPRSTVAACDRTTVDLARITEEVPG